MNKMFWLKIPVFKFSIIWYRLCYKGRLNRRVWIRWNGFHFRVQYAWIIDEITWPFVNWNQTVSPTKSFSKASNLLECGVYMWFKYIWGSHLVLDLPIYIIKNGVAVCYVFQNKTECRHWWFNDVSGEPITSHLIFLSHIDVGSNYDKFRTIVNYDS